MHWSVGESTARLLLCVLIDTIATRASVDMLYTTVYTPLQLSLVSGKCLETGPTENIHRLFE